MPELTLETAQLIVSAALKAAREKSFKPLSIVVYDARGALKALASEDGTSLKRAEIAMGKAYGALAMGVGSRALHKMATDRPYFVAAASHVVGGQLVPVPGGVLIKDAKGQILGAVGVSGDTSDNDEIVAAAGIGAAGLTFDAGA
ncbi:GlcG/HbpS family heme-binding protein [Microvirga sp. 2TAF3]|uniref:GlcG/HbpS family heme-binding protein n=1 Tax=Microvirga sp. 2TAF3 TaxID=3233014 RepID=UPI003F97F388